MDKFILKSSYTLPGEMCIDVIRGFEMDEMKYKDDTFEHLLIDKPIWSSVKDVMEYTVDDSFTEYASKMENILDTKCWWSKESREISGRSNFNIKKLKKGFKSVWNNFTDDNRARVGFIIFLNTPSDEISGSIEFHTGRKIKPVRGDIILFPNTWAHLFKHSKVDENLYILSGYFNHQ